MEGELTHADYSFLLGKSLAFPTSQNHTKNNNPAIGITTITKTWYLCHQGQPPQKINLRSLAKAH